jgi:hypothetical protein
MTTILFSPSLGSITWRASNVIIIFLFCIFLLFRITSFLSTPDYVMPIYTYQLGNVKTSHQPDKLDHESCEREEKQLGPAPLQRQQEEAVGWPDPG